MRNTPSRGQNTVLVMLTMLLMTLLVTMTIGLGFRIRQNHELQNLADASAYSNAVATARLFNNSAMLNRVEVADYVSILADQSLMSWTTYVRAVLKAAAQKAAAAASSTECPHNNGAAVAAVLNAADSSNFAAWAAADQSAGEEAISIQGAIEGRRKEMEAKLIARLTAINDQSVTQAVINASQLSDVTKLTGDRRGGTGPAAVNRGELQRDCSGDLNQKGLCVGETNPPNQFWSNNMLDAAMGSRASPFLTERQAVPPVLQQLLAQVPEGASVTTDGESGSAYYDKTQSHSAHMDKQVAWSDDHGEFTVNLTGHRDLPDGGTEKCTLSVKASADSKLKSTDKADETDVHTWTGNSEADAHLDHTMGKCTACPSVWVATGSFGPTNDAADAYGQPRSVASLVRDLTGEKLKWELTFSFALSPTGTARTWDGTGKQLHGDTGGLDITHQAAVATAITYYHHSQNFNEYPNLLNPFWRATLVPNDVDGSNDVADTLYGRHHQFQRDAWDALINAGYKGLH